MWTGDIMFANAYELIVFILNFIGIYEPINNIFKTLGIEYVLRIIIVLKQERGSRPRSNDGCKTVSIKLPTTFVPKSI